MLRFCATWIIAAQGVVVSVTCLTHMQPLDCSAAQFDLIARAATVRRSLPV